jgi:hypothetical protein
MKVVILVFVWLQISLANALTQVELQELRVTLSQLNVTERLELYGDKNEINILYNFIKTDWIRISKSLPELEPNDVSIILAVAMNRMTDFEYLEFTIAMLYEIKNDRITHPLHINYIIAPNYLKEYFCALNYDVPLLRKALIDVKKHLVKKESLYEVDYISDILSGSAKGSCDKFMEDNLLEPLPTLEELRLTGRNDRNGWTKALAQSARNKARLTHDPNSLSHFSLRDIILLLFGIGLLGLLVYYFWPKRYVERNGEFDA